MIEYKTTTYKTKSPEKIICDKCGREATQEGESVFEYQEFHCISFVGGYGSEFGDECLARCDLCQHCLKEMIGGICRIGYMEDNLDKIDGREGGSDEDEDIEQIKWRKKYD